MGADLRTLIRLASIIPTREPPPSRYPPFVARANDPAPLTALPMPHPLTDGTTALGPKEMQAAHHADQWSVYGLRSAGVVCGQNLLSTLLNAQSPPGTRIRGSRPSYPRLALWRGIWAPTSGRFATTTYELLPPPTLPPVALAATYGSGCWRPPTYSRSCSRCRSWASRSLRGSGHGHAAHRSVVCCGRLVACSAPDGAPAALGRRRDVMAI